MALGERASERLTAHPRFPGRNLQSDRPLVDLKEREKKINRQIQVTVMQEAKR